MVQTKKMANVTGGGHMLPKFSTTILLFNVKICQGWWVLHLNPTVFSENDPTQTWPWRARKMGQDARYRIGVWIVRLDPKTPWKKQGKRWWCNLVRSFLLRKMMMHFQFPKHPPQKKKNSEVSTSFTLLARYPTWSNWNSWQLDVADPRHPGLAFGWREATGRKEAPTVEAHPGW